MIGPRCVGRLHHSDLLELYRGRREVHDAFAAAAAAGDEDAATWVFDHHNVVFSFCTLMAVNASRKDFTFDFAGDEDEDDNELLAGPPGAQI
jgi:hypothetical protein